MSQKEEVQEVEEGKRPREDEEEEEEEEEDDDEEIIKRLPIKKRLEAALELCNEFEDVINELNVYDDYLEPIRKKVYARYIEEQRNKEKEEEEEIQEVEEEEEGKRPREEEEEEEEEEYFEDEIELYTEDHKTLAYRAVISFLREELGNLGAESDKVEKDIIKFLKERRKDYMLESNKPKVDSEGRRILDNCEKAEMYEELSERYREMLGNAKWDTGDLRRIEKEIKDKWHNDEV